MSEQGILDGPMELDYAALAAEFSPEEQNSAAWLSLVLLLAENRAMVDALRKLILSKGLATEEETVEAIKNELEQPALGNWYAFVNQLYAYRVAETLELQRQQKAGEVSEEEAPIGDLTDVSGGVPIPTGAPPITGSATIVQADPEPEKV
jgi:hypothetical protein